MKTKLHRILVLALSFVLLLSSIGVAQVSHFCTMALAGMEVNSCSDVEDEHPCCQEVEAGNLEESCCTDQIRYFHYKVNSTVQESLKSIPVQTTVITLLFHIISFSDNYSENNLFQKTNFPPGEPGSPIFISVQSLLI